MNRRPLVVFTVCWLCGAASAHLYGGMRLAAVLSGLTLLLIAAALCARTPGKPLLLFALALWIAAGYGTLREASNVSAVPQRLGAAVEGGYAGVRLQGKMAGPAKVDGDLAMFEMQVDQVAGGAAFDVPKPAAAGTVHAPNAGNAFKPLSKSETVVVRVKLAAEAEQAVAASWRRGDRLIVSGDLERPAEARNFGAFDYRRYLRDKRIHWVARAAGASGVSRSEAAPGGFNLLRRNDELRAFLAERLERLYPGIGAGYMQGLLLGLQDGLDPGTHTDFIRLGMTHVLAISGMHVALYVGGALLLLRRSGMPKETALLIVLCLVPPYVLLTGSSPSAVRAGIMGMIALYAARRGWLKDGLPVLCLAALLMLVWAPYYLTSISFQLSFAVTAGIIVLTAPMRRILRILRGLPKAVAAGAAVSLVADLVSFPLSLYYFNQYPLLGLAANLVLVPLISFVSIPVGTISLLLGTFWMQGAQWAAYPVRLLNAAVFSSAEAAGSVQAARTIWASPSPLWMLLYEAALIGGLCLLAAHLEARRPSPADGPEALGGAPAPQQAHSSPGGFAPDTVPLAPGLRAAGLPAAAASPSVRYGGPLDDRRAKLRPIGAAAAGLVWACLIASAYTPRFDPAGVVQMLDVGQGDSILVTTPQGKQILIDGGGTVTFERPGEAWKRRLDPYEVGREVVVPLLKQRGVHALDAVILTHGDRDHYGGLLAVMDEIPVDRFIMNGTRSGGEDLDKLFAAALAHGTEIYAPQGGDLWQPDERTSLEFLSPSGAFADTSALPRLEEQNEHSVVFRLEMNGHSFVFTGDIGAEAERDILERFGGSEQAGEVEVLKVAHHGSKHSSSAAWVRSFSPELSLISAGVNNTYGHPNPDVVQRLEDAGSAVRRTDLDGEIQVSTPFGEPLRIRTKLARAADPAGAER